MRVALALCVACAGCLPELALDDCLEAERNFACKAVRTTLATADGDRVVHSRVPDGDAPAGGFPVVVAFQGSGFPAVLFFESRDGMPFGGDVQGRVVQRLLRDGFAVIAPEAQGAGHGYWDTNVVGRADAWDGTPDDAFMRALFDALDDEELGALDPTRLRAMGISSGGYMTSRMAVSYPRRFSALAIMAGSYATCSGVLCVLPDELPTQHPPTLFLHGARDAVVPEATMRPYAERLEDDGVAVKVVTDADVGHAWIEAAVDEVAAFFAAHGDAG